MAKALVLGSVKTRFLGVHSLGNGSERIITSDVSNRVLMAAWLASAQEIVGAMYGVLAIRVGTLASSTEGVSLKNGWFGGSMTSASVLHGEGIAWYGELPLFDERPLTLVLYVRNDSGFGNTFTGGYAWKELEENDRPT